MEREREKEIKYIPCRHLGRRHLSNGICNEIRRLLIMVADVGYDDRKGNIETALNRIAKSSATSASICESTSRALYSIRERIDKATPIRISIRWQRRFSLAGTTGHAEPGAGFTKKSESSPGLSLANVTGLFANDVVSDCLVFTACKRLLQNFLAKSSQV